MKLSFLGAAHEVTGSCHFIEACGKKILVDCGMQQGQDDDTQELPVVPADIDYLFLTHAQTTIGSAAFFSSARWN